MLKIVGTFVAFTLLAGVPVAPRASQALSGVAAPQSESRPMLEAPSPDVDRLTACLAAVQAVDDAITTPSASLGDCSSGVGHTSAQMLGDDGGARWNVTGQVEAETRRGGAGGLGARFAAAVSAEIRLLRAPFASRPMCTPHAWQRRTFLAPRLAFHAPQWPQVLRRLQWQPRAVDRSGVRPAIPALSVCSPQPGAWRVLVDSP